MPLKVDTVIAGSLNASTLVINGADVCSTSSVLFENIPFIVQPTFTKTCTQITNTIQGGAPNLKGYKLARSAVLYGDTSYETFLGTIRIINGTLNISFPILWKVSGSVFWEDPSFEPVLITEPLGRINRGLDSNGGTILIESDFVNFYDFDGDDLIIYVVLFVGVSELAPNPLVGDLELYVSFELETLIFDNQEVVYTYEEFLP
jgi:hypothetical protein